MPPIAGLRDVGYVTHIEALAAQQKPEALVVIGAGAVGLEFGQMYARFGTQVTILQRSGSIYRRTVSFADVPKAIIMRRTEGLIKMVAMAFTRDISKLSCCV